MKTHLLGAVAAAGLSLALPFSASAATFISQLEYRDGLVGAQSPSFGTVTLDEIDANTVRVTVALTNPASLFINTGGPHDPFLFNTQHDDVVTILPPVGSFSDAGHGSFQATPFGTFSDKIACCLSTGDVSAPDVYATDIYGPDHYASDVYANQHYAADVLGGDYFATSVVLDKHGKVVYNIGDVIHKPADFHYGAQHVIHHAGDLIEPNPIIHHAGDVIVGSNIIIHHAGDPILDEHGHGHSHVVTHAGDELNGAAHGQSGPLVFTVANAGGITFAGLGYTIDADGKVTGLGTGEHFTSNDGGWWFSADIFDGATGQTYNVAARDAFGPKPLVSVGVPEPATWGLMIVGFGGVGALLRRSRRQARAALA